jgi:hypothetical protein
VVSVVGKGTIRLCQVRFRETNESEPLMRCRKQLGDVKTGGLPLPPEEPRGNLLTIWVASSHAGGVNLDQALVWNVGTCRPDAKGETQAGRTRKSESTDAGHRGGPTRSSVEVPVMGMERRGWIIWPNCLVNQ